jgi:26S proteasome regulatory subunit N5
VGQNIRVIASYYSRISMTRLTELLDLPPLTTERTLCKLVTEKTIYARIDRPTGIVNFKAQRKVGEVMNDWSRDLDKMLGLVEKTSHLVAKVR